jgi:hypothetical protein
LPIPEDQREFLIEVRSLGRDDEGSETLVGLSAEETDFYFQFIEDRRKHVLPLGAERITLTDRWLSLDSKHQAARMQVLAAEAEARLAGLKH